MKDLGYAGGRKLAYGMKRNRTLEKDSGAAGEEQDRGKKAAIISWWCGQPKKRRASTSETACIEKSRRCYLSKKASVGGTTSTV